MSEEERTRLTDSMELRVRALATGLRQLRRRVHYVDYKRAEADCELLAAKLLAHVSRAELMEFSFAAIPRGGLIVLGMLAYVLDLAPEQLSETSDPTRPLAVIDDCALTGRRFVEFASGRANPHILFAMLYSHPSLRESLMAKEPRLKACLAAGDLEDLAPDHFERLEDYETWRKRLTSGATSGKVWQGALDLLGFAWSEPENIFWNPVSDRVESGWRYLPPHRCLQNKAALGLPPRAVPAARMWQVTASVVTGYFENQLWLCQMETEQVYSLDEVGSEMWRAIAGYGDLEVVTEYLLSRYEVDAESLSLDLSAFAAEMLRCGLLERV